MSIQLVVAGGSRAGQVIPIMGDRFVIGRADDCNLKPRSELISRYHCEIFLQDGTAFVRDMGSKNGVILNGTKITEPNVLKNGDKLVIGPLDFFVHLTVEIKAKKMPKVKSVSDAVARTMALSSGGTDQMKEDVVTDWLLAAGESSDDLETQTIDASMLRAHLQAQSENAANAAEPELPNPMHNAGKQESPHSSQDAASIMLRRFFKGGK